MMNLRQPKIQFKGRNGFDEYSKQFPTEHLKEAEAVEAQDVARFVLREMGSFFPSLEEMKKEVDTPETIATITERIKRLKKEHADTMAKLSRYYAQQLYDDATDRYCQTDDIKYFDFEDFTKTSDEWAQHYARIEALFRRNKQSMTADHNDIVSRAQYEHLRELLPLYARRRELEKIEETARIKRAAQFPESILQYRRMGRKDEQLLVARFLMADEAKQDIMRSQSGWAWRQTEPLIRMAQSNMSFQSELKGLVGEYESRDPRSRR